MNTLWEEIDRFYLAPVVDIFFRRHAKTLKIGKIFNTWKVSIVKYYLPDRATDFAERSQGTQSSFSGLSSLTANFLAYHNKSS